MRIVLRKRAAASRGLQCRVASARSAATRPAVDWDSVNGILFDIDGTLTHSDDLHFEAFVKILQFEGYQEGEPITREFFNSSIAGRHNPLIAADLFPHWTAEQGIDFAERKEALFREMAAGGLLPVPGLLAFLDAIDRRGIRKLAVTNSTPPNVALMLSAIGLSEYFEGVVFGADCARAKPHPDPYWKGLQLLDLQAGEALVFEDSPAGVASGVAAGVRVIGLATTQPPSVLTGLGACTVIDDYATLLPL